MKPKELTKLEYFTAIAMQGMLPHFTAQGGLNATKEVLAQQAVMVAKAVLTELEKNA